MFATTRLAGSSAAGIPRLVTSNRTNSKSYANKSDNNDDVREGLAAGSGVGSRRLVTVVESKKKSTNNGNANENIIDCTRNF